MTTNATKGGTARNNGANLDHGKVVHLIPGIPANGYWGDKALCGTTPGTRSYGWDETDRPANCPDCLAKQNKNERRNQDPYGGLGSEMDTNSMNYNSLKF